ncbi:hypothetical protein IE077_001475, partial [Cardiosporidium cionae]
MRSSSLQKADLTTQGPQINEIHQTSAHEEGILCQFDTEILSACQDLLIENSVKSPVIVHSELANLAKINEDFSNSFANEEEHNQTDQQKQETKNLTILSFNESDQIYFHADDEHSNNSRTVTVVNKETLQTKSKKKFKYEEPEGTTGKKFRIFVTRYYGRFLSNPYVKIVVLLVFAAHFCFAGVGFLSLKAGLSLQDVTPPISYLRDFYRSSKTYFSAYGDRVTVFFPNVEMWENKAMQQQLMIVSDEIVSLDKSIVSNGMYAFLKENMDTLQDENVTEFNE